MSRARGNVLRRQEDKRLRLAISSSVLSKCKSKLRSFKQLSATGEGVIVLTMASKKKQEGDERFLRVQKDPRFWEMPEKEHKIKIDKRFKSMFHDKRFKVKYTVDKRGRPISHCSTDDLKRFYNVSDSDEEEEEGSTAAEKKKGVKPKGKAATEGRRKAETLRVVEDDDEDDDEQQSADEDSDSGDGVSGDSEEDDDDAEEDSGREDEESGLDSGDDSDSGPDLARGQGNIETSSDEDDEGDVEDILRREEEEIEHDWGELCKDALRSDEVSARLAVCNMDWDRMKAKDLLVLFSSFVPKGGAVLSVKIYPSEFGKERLKMEETQGPLELKALPDDSEDDTEEERVHREKLRDYQFKRLKYFYAVVQCDSVSTAAKIYEECDGFEYESSSSVLDLRFIPDEVTFDEEPKDAATDVNLSAYTPKLFSSSAAATSKVTLTWDETDHERVSALNRKFNKAELLDMDFNAYLASSSEEEEEEEEQEEVAAGGEGTAEEEEEEERRKRKVKKSEEQMKTYRELLRTIQDKEKQQQEDKDMEMEITWVPGLKETTEQLVKKKLEGRDQLTPWEEYLQKKKEKKKQKKKRRSDRKQEAADEDFSDEELPPDVDLSDPFFSSELGASDLKKKKKKNQEQRPAEEEEELQSQKAQMVLLMEEDGADAKHEHFNYDRIVEQQNLGKKKKKKLLKKGEEPPEDDHFQVDVKDPRFQAMFTSHLFNLDPSHPSFKKTRATQSILEEKQRRRAEEATPTQEGPARKQETAETSRDKDSGTKTMDPSLSLLVKSIRSKTEQFQARKKPRLV
ncbi:ESF1 homolog isoform X2 [Kryptolebias marmoratus]|uniref:ESF1 homolog isoform X2 n=1 Tax=Kryptolebias marmoratus TaxID=37003 RepID=UPI0018ACD494|nr:ESF1 homolog isoform X2 [Kryptolebias marmoratus]